MIYDIWYTGTYVALGGGGQGEGSILKNSL